MKKIGGLVSGGLLLVCAHVHAQNFGLGTSPEAVGSGARAMGQGNAFIAVADDATAAAWNPGGLAQLEKPEISFALETLSRRSRMDVPGHPESENTHSVGLEDLNFLSLVYPFRAFNRHAVVSLNYLKQYRFDQDFHGIVSLPGNPAPGFQTDFDYSLDQSGDLSVLAPALAIDVTNKLSLGLTVNVWNHSVTGSSECGTDVRFEDDLTMPFPPFNVVTDNHWTWNTEVDDGYSLVIGGLYRLSKQWTVGAVLKPAYTLSFYEKQELNGVPADHQIEIEMPWTVGAGMAWRPNDPLTLSLDVSWTDWSKYVLDDWDDVERNPLTNRSIEDDKCEDTVAVRLGLEYLLVREATVIPLRAGLAYDGAPAVGEVDNHYTASIGVGYQCGRFMADLAYEYRWGRDLAGGGVWGYLEPSEDAERHRLLLSLIVYL